MAGEEKIRKRKKMIKEIYLKGWLTATHDKCNKMKLCPIEKKINHREKWKVF